MCSYRQFIGDADSQGWRRRGFLRCAGAGLAALASGRSPCAAETATGAEDPRLASFDRLMTTFCKRNKVPGAVLAVAHANALVYARGFGFADEQNVEVVRPRSLFRIASISKPFTAVAVLRLVERGKLKLDDCVVNVLNVRLDGAAVPPKDPRLQRVTIRHLLQHTGGWDRNTSFDPMFRPIRIARELHKTPPAGPDLIIPYMWRLPLDFDPGTRSAYSNFGYCVLGRIIERVSGMPYAEYMQKEILAPLGIRDMRVGKSLLAGRLPGEVRYYMGGKDMARAVLGPKAGQQVPAPYGGSYIEAMDAHGGWVASAPDLVRFATAFNDPGHSAILKAASIQVMFAPPHGSVGHRGNGKPKQTYYGCGWQVRHAGPDGAINTWHSGLLDGTSTLLVRRFDGIAWAVLFNTSTTPSGKTPVETIDPLLHTAADAVKEWPAKDLFGEMLG